MSLLGGILGGVLNPVGHNPNESHNLGIFEPIANLADIIIEQIVTFVLGVIGAALGFEVKLKSVLTANVSLLPTGKLYRLTLLISVKINHTWVDQKYEADVFFPFLGPLECRSYKKIN